MKPINWSGRTKGNQRLLIGLLAGLLFLIIIICLFLSGSQPEPIQQAKASPKPKPAPVKVELVLFASGLPNTTNIVSAGPPADRRLFVTDRSGYIRIIDGTGQVANDPFLDVSKIVHVDAEMGLLGLAFSPKYSSNGFFFINYIDKDQNTVIARYHVSSDANKADPDSGQILLTLKQPYPNHNGGDLLFGPDGYLYAALGDGGGAGDPGDRAQNLNVLFGKILRLDVSQAPYKIPADNPFVNQAGKAGEIWDYGLRNPWRISFDRQTRQLYIADVGQGTAEEINIEPAGKGGNNYGWRCYEANLDFNLTGCQSRGQYVFPVLSYDHNQGRCSITGGYVYRGKKIPEFFGKYFYGDFCSGQVYMGQIVNAKWQAELAAATPYQISTFGEDSQGELYLADFTAGAVYRLQQAR